MRLERYNSIEEYAKLVNEACGAGKNRRSNFSNDDYYSSSASWDAGVGFSKAIQFAIKGDPSLVSEYTEDIDKMIAEYQIKEEPRKRYVSSVAGSRVSVPEYLGGSPRCMKAKMPQEIGARSINIYVSTTCSAVIDAKNMLKRGKTILALLEFLHMSQVNVELFLLAETHGQTDGDLIQVINVQSHPLDLSTAGFAIAHPAFARKITYAMAEHLDNFNGYWGQSWGRSDYQEKLAKLIGMSDQDIYIPAPHVQNLDIMQNPEVWLASNIAKIKEKLETTTVENPNSY